MKTISYFLAALYILLMATESSYSQTEHQEYTVIQQFPGFEVRHYPPALLASTYSEATTYEEVSRPGFRTLASYIFGENETGVKIPMTAPVHINLTDEGSFMSFVMPSLYTIDDIPKPISDAIKLHQSREEYAAAITFGGYASDEKIQNESLKLQRYLNQNQIKTSGNFRFLGYNSPYRFWNRRNEIIVSIIWE